MNTEKVTRLEVIDHTDCKGCGGSGWVKPKEPKTRQGRVVMREECSQCHGMGMPGRTVVFWDKDKTVELSLQDGDRTLKVFVGHRKHVESDAKSIGRVALAD